HGDAGARQAQRDRRRQRRADVGGLCRGQCARCDRPGRRTATPATPRYAGTAERPVRAPAQAVRQELTRDARFYTFLDCSLRGLAWLNASRCTARATKTSPGCATCSAAAPATCIRTGRSTAAARPTWS